MRHGDDAWYDGERGGELEAPASLAARRTPAVLCFSFTQGATAIGLFRAGDPVRAGTVRHGGVPAARAPRLDSIRSFLREAGFGPGSLGAVAVCAEAPRPLEAGIYAIDERMLRDGADDAALAAASVAREWGCPAVTIDPASPDEWCEAERRAASASCVRPLRAMKAAARRYARAVERPVDELRLVIAHLGAGASCCLQRCGRIADAQRVFDTGPGATLDLEAALSRAEAGDRRASALVHSAATEVAKVIGGLATVLEGEVDAVLLTGPLERAGLVIAELCRRVEWIAPVFPYRDEDELQALSLAAHALLRGEEPLKRA